MKAAIVLAIFAASAAAAPVAQVLETPPDFGPAKRQEEIGPPPDFGPGRRQVSEFPPDFGPARRQVLETPPDFGPARRSAQDDIAPPPDFGPAKRQVSEYPPDFGPARRDAQYEDGEIGEPAGVIPPIDFPKRNAQVSDYPPDFGPGKARRQVRDDDDNEDEFPVGPPPDFGPGKARRDDDEDHEGPPGKGHGRPKDKPSPWDPSYIVGHDIEFGDKHDEPPCDKGNKTEVAGGRGARPSKPFREPFPAATSTKSKMAAYPSPFVPVYPTKPHNGSFFDHGDRDEHDNDKRQASTTAEPITTTIPGRDGPMTFTIHPTPPPQVTTATILMHDGWTTITTILPTPKYTTACDENGCSTARATRTITRSPQATKETTVAFA